MKIQLELEIPATYNSGSHMFEPLSSSNHPRTLQKSSIPERCLQPEAILELIPHQRRILIITDKDGTLDIAHQTQAIAATPASTINTLCALMARSSGAVSVAIVSGRKLEELRLLTSDMESTWYFGNHGLEFKHPGKVSSTIPVSSDYSKAINSCEEMLRSLTARDPAMYSGLTIERDGYKLNCWWTENFKSRSEFLRCLDDAIEQSLIREHCELLYGISSREILPTGAGKKAATATLIDYIKPDFVLCAGNDLPDLGMFEHLSMSLTPHINIIVGTGIAFDGAHHIACPDALTELFERLLERYI